MAKAAAIEQATVESHAAVATAGAGGRGAEDEEQEAAVRSLPAAASCSSASFQNAIHFVTKNGFRARANGGIW